MSDPERPGASAPDEAARPAVPVEHPEVLRLAHVARARVAQARGGRMLSGRDEPIDELESSLTHLAGGATDRAVWVGTLDDQIVGYAFATIEPVTDGETVAVLHEVFVEPEARGVGVGEALLDVAVDWAEAHGCSGIESRALPGDRATKNFFEAAGMVARLIVVHRDFKGSGR